MLLTLLLPSKYSRDTTILYWLLWGFIATLYWQPTMIITNIFIGLIFCCSFYYNRTISFFPLIKKRWYLIFMLLFFLWSITSVLLSKNQHSGWSTLQLRIPLLLFTCSVGLLQIPRELFDKLLYWFSLFTVVAAILCITAALRQTMQSGNSAYLYNDALTSFTGKQSIYISTLVNLSVFSIIYLLSSTSLPGKPLLYFCLLILFVFSFLLAGRNAMIVLYSFILLYAFLYLLKNKKYLELFTLLIGMIIGIVVLFKLFPKTFNRFKELTYTNYNYSNTSDEAHYAGTLTADQWNGANFRLAVWRCGWEMAKSNFLTGVGLGDRKDILFAIYEKKNFTMAIKTKKNLHNQYLDILSSLGVIGLIFFMLGFIIGPLVYAVKRKNLLALAVILTFAFALITDNFLDRSFSTIVFSFFIPFILVINNQD